MQIRVGGVIVQTMEMANCRSIAAGVFPATTHVAADKKGKVWRGGLVLIQQGAEIPDTEVGGTAVRDWNYAVLPVAEFQESLKGTDWQWSCYVPSLTQKAWGATRDGAISRAVQAVLAKATMKGMNSAEIAAVAIRRVLGLYRAEVNVGLRSLQRGPFLKKLTHRRRVEYGGHRRGLTAVASTKGLHMKAM